MLAFGNEKLVTLYTSVPLLDELAEILSRSKFDRKIAASQRSAEQLVHLYAALTTVVRSQAVPRIAPDPDDDVVIGTAVASGADLIVSGDRALLSVATYRNTKIVAVADALATLKASESGTSI